jgi:hypothetical protein
MISFLQPKLPVLELSGLPQPPRRSPRPFPLPIINNIARNGRSVVENVLKMKPQQGTPTGAKTRVKSSADADARSASNRGTRKSENGGLFSMGTGGRIPAGKTTGHSMSRSTSGKAVSSEGDQSGRRSASPGGGKCHHRSTSPTSKVLSNIWQTEFVFDAQMIRTPKKICFMDYQCLKPLEIIDLRGWRVNSDLFELMHTSNKEVLKELYLDHTVELTADRLESIRGAPKLRILSLQSTITVNAQFGKLMGSFPSLTELDVSDCPVEYPGIEFMSTTCQKLRKLTMCNNRGLDDICLLNIATWVQRFRQLSHVYFRKCEHFTDDGVLEFLAVCQPLIRTLSFESCRKLTSLSLAGLRKPMKLLESLDISGMLLGQTPFEWLSEGCIKLKCLNVSRSAEFDDESLIRIAKQCPLIEDLNLSKCVKVSDAGIVGFMELFEGSLSRLDMSLCILCGSKSVLAIAAHAQSLLEIKLSGLSQVTAPALVQLWKNASKLNRFDMIVELRVTSTHRRSLLAHVTDEVLQNLCSTRLKELNLTGACLITNSGIASLAQYITTHLHNLDISWCNKVSDEALVMIGKYCSHLKKLNISGCDIHDEGLDAICTGCGKLQELQINGCPRLTNCGIACIACLKGLELLSARNCEHVTPAPWHLVARSCSHLKVLDISGLDLVTVDVVESVAKYCKGITRLCAEHCSMNSIEFGAGSRTRLPLSVPVSRCCKLEPRPTPVVKFNLYVLHMRRYLKAAIRIQRYIRKIWDKLIADKNRAIEAINEALENKRKAFKSKKQSQSEKYRFKPTVVHPDVVIPPARLHAACILQRWCRHVNGIKFAKWKVVQQRRRMRSAVLIQSRFRGHASRKRCYKLFQRLYVYYSRIGHIVHKLMVLSRARRLHRQILQVQSVGRMFPRKLIYRLTLQAFITFQLRVRNYCKRKWACVRTLGKIVDIICVKDDSAVCIQKSWRAKKFNRMLVEFARVCAHWYIGDVAGENWSVTKIQALVRGHLLRDRLFQSRNIPLARKRAAVAIQRISRGKLARKYVKGVRIYKRIMSLRWRIILCALPCLRLGIPCKRIQRRWRLYIFRRDRWNSAEKIQRAYVRHKNREAHMRYLFDCLDRFSYSVAINYRRYKGRLWRMAKLTREHMAAWKMQKVLGQRMKEINRKRKKLAEAGDVHLQLMQEKKRLVHVRRLAVSRLNSASSFVCFYDLCAS